MLPAFILYLPTCFLLSSKCSQCSFSPLYAQRSWKNKSSVACTHCALLRSGYKYLSFHTSLSTILYSLSIILIPVHLDFFFFFSFAAGAFVLRQSESGWKATVRENIVYWLIVCSFVPCSPSSRRRTHEAILLDTIYEHCALKWNGRRSRIIVYFMTRGRATTPPMPNWRAKRLPSTPTGCDVVVCQRHWHAQGP